MSPNICPHCGNLGHAVNSIFFACDRGHRWQASDWDLERNAALARKRDYERRCLEAAHAQAEAGDGIFFSKVTL